MIDYISYIILQFLKTLKNLLTHCWHPRSEECGKMCLSAKIHIQCLQKSCLCHMILPGIRSEHYQICMMQCCCMISSSRVVKSQSCQNDLWFKMESKESII